MLRAAGLTRCATSTPGLSQALEMLDSATASVTSLFNAIHADKSVGAVERDIQADLPIYCGIIEDRIDRPMSDQFPFLPAVSEYKNGK